MAPREPSKLTPKVQRKTVTNTNITKTPLKKAVAKTVPNKVDVKTNNCKVIETQRRINSIPVIISPKSAQKSLRKKYLRPAHSGVPVPEKMKKMWERQLRALQAEEKSMNQDKEEKPRLPEGI